MAIAVYQEIFSETDWFKFITWCDVFIRWGDSIQLTKIPGWIELVRKIKTDAFSFLSLLTNRLFLAFLFSMLTLLLFQRFAL